MMRLGSRDAWLVLVLGTLAGCRLGFDELDSYVGPAPSSSGGDTALTGSGGRAGAAAGGAVNVGGALANGGALDDAGSAGEIGAANGGGADQGGAAPYVAGSGGTEAASGSGGAGSGGLAAAAGNPSAGVGGTSSGGTSSGGASAGGSSGTAGATGGSLGSGGTSGASGSASGGSAGAPSLPNCQTKYFNARPYLLCSPEVSWDSAKSSCASVGMVLARVDNSAENQWLFANAYDVGTASTGMWIGARESLLEGTWQWADGTLFWIGGLFGAAQSGLYTNWASSQPGSLLNDCGAINLGAATSGTWFSDLCSLGTNVYACESTQ